MITHPPNGIVIICITLHGCGCYMNGIGLIILNYVLLWATILFDLSDRCEYLVAPCRLPQYDNIIISMPIANNTTHTLIYHVT